MKHIIQIFFVATCFISQSVSAQWVWVDQAGRKVFSDRAPSAQVPEKNILKRPGQTSINLQQEIVNPSDASTGGAGVSAAGAAQTAASATKPSGLDKELADRKLKATQAIAAKRKAEEDLLTKARAENCERAKSAKANFESGARISRINRQGEREVLDDAARDQELKRIQVIISTDCG